MRRARTLTLAAMAGAVWTGRAYAAGSGQEPVNMAAAYVLCAAVSLGLAVWYRRREKKAAAWMTRFLTAVFTVNLGYSMLALSKTLEMALWGNRVAYLGSAFLPLCMLMALASACQTEIPRRWILALTALATGMFLLAASPGFCGLYYKEVELVFVGGMAQLEKVYGPLHNLYLYYVLLMVGLMVALLVRVLVRQKTVPVKYAGVLVTIAVLNLLIWIVERLTYTEFELLAVSYIVSAMLVLMLHDLMEEFGSLAQAAQAAQAARDMGEEPTAPHPGEGREPGFSESGAEALMERWQAVEALTQREREVLRLLLLNRKRRDMAEELSVTEHTVKKHTANIFSKMGVSSRTELFEKAERETGT